MISIWSCWRLPVLASLLIVSCSVTFEEARSAAPRLDRLSGLSGPGKISELARYEESSFRPLSANCRLSEESRQDLGSRLLDQAQRLRQSRFIPVVEVEPDVIGLMGPPT